MKQRIDSLLANWSEFSLNKKFAVALATGVIGVGATALTVSLTSPDYTIYMSNIDNRDIQEVVATLDANKINYKIGRNNTLLVDSAQHDVTRAALARDGLPSKGHDGYALLSTATNVYTSQVKENLFKNQILEEEMSKLINTIDGVESSKIKLALSKESQFLRDTDPASASVVLTLKRGAALSKGQIHGIINIVSSGIPNLPPENVTILDQTGRLLSQIGEDYFGGNHLDYRQSYERELRSKITEIVAPIVGLDSFRVNVSTSFNFDRVENTTETPVDSTVIISQQKETTYDQTLSGGAGVPGALSNQPPEHAKFSDKPVSANTGSDENAIGHQKTVTNYSTGRSITHTKNASGKLETTSVAIVFDQTDKTPEEVASISQSIQTLVSASLTFVEGRDKITVQAMNFYKAPEVVEPEPEFWEHPLFKQGMTGAKYLLFALVLFLAWRSLLNRIAPVSKKSDELEEITPPSFTVTAESLENNDLFDFPSEDESNRIDEDYSTQMNKAYKLVDTDPNLTLEVIKGMVAGREYLRTHAQDEDEEEDVQNVSDEDAVAAMMAEAGITLDEDDGDKK
ncbi:flagellar basal-body MS-ring/collar protein FliF [Vibrio sp. D431a]|uniref:flagellar basal-body MS-ring/collar protein FliF n=1 Tax=Vibrio sp. D431a TaxID=2837388 RepID=UPI0025548288|nr:flagellar basal-body MS-ring/collar protein FliF [Vibrio sp. D431a]MDK9793916.1 flagellar M-ring protein FliF [Vibrio sp. D431a]